MDGNLPARVELVVKLKDIHNMTKRNQPVVDGVKPKKAPEVKDATLAHVSKSGEFIRTYSLEVHGEDFAKLAAEFASKDEGRVVVLG